MRKTLVVASIVLTTAAAAFGTPPLTVRDTGAEHVFFVDNVAFNAGQRIVGANVDLGNGVISNRHVDALGAEIYWKVYRDVDAGPMRHVFYQQMLRRNGIDAQLLGGYLSLHFRVGQGLTSMMGTRSGRPVCRCC